MKLLLSLMVIMIVIPGFAKMDNWEPFNSSLLIEVTRPHGVFTCTGVAINDTTLMTAAHCLEGAIKSVKIFTGSNYDPAQKSLLIKDFKIHPKYDSKKSRYLHDVAKITLAEKLPSFIRIHPIFRGVNVSGTLYRFGFGERNKKNLRTVITPKLRRINLNEGILELNDEFSRSGDSGGPIFLQTGQDISILALHSTFSHGPEGNYSLNPLLGSYTDWIFSH